MATVEQNEQMWDRTYDWRDGGDEWSDGWGGPERQWRHWILPRVLRSLGSDRIDGRVVEIGCGHGRWTQFLAEHPVQVLGVDVSGSCVEQCNRRFSDAPHVRAVRCDGRSLPGVADASVSLLFSFDSLVHADAPTVERYLSEADRVLTDDGVMFLHHSNLAAYRFSRARTLRRSAVLTRLLARFGRVEPEVHWRDPSVDADLVLRAARRNGLAVVDQELIRWGTRRAFIDCVSVAVRSGSPRARPLTRVENTRFELEMAAAARAPR